MSVTLVGVGVVILAVIAGLWAWTRRIRKAGEDSVKANMAKDALDVMVEQDKAAAKAPKTKDELIDRLRRGGF